MALTEEEIVERAKLAREVARTYHPELDEEWLRSYVAWKHMLDLIGKERK